MHATGMEGEGIKGIIEDARLEDLSHFESCIERIFQLGGSLPNDAKAFIKKCLVVNFYNCQKTLPTLKQF